MSPPLFPPRKKCRALSLLTLCGYEVHDAADGPSGLAEVLAWRPDAVVSDIGMPGMDGWALAERVRAQMGTAVLLIALTGYGAPDDVERSFRAGFDAHLTKPADPKRLLGLLSPRN
jgi:two-component system, chemotaxis family, CheB/CheR fusion protein